MAKSIRTLLVASACLLGGGCVSHMSSEAPVLEGSWSGYAICRYSAKPYVAGIQLKLARSKDAGVSHGHATLSRKNSPDADAKSMLFKVVARRNAETGVTRLYTLEHGNALFLTVRTAPELSTQLCGNQVKLKPGFSSIEALMGKEEWPR